MSKQRIADILYGISTFLALLMAMVSIYDDREGWRIGLNCLLFVFCAAGLVVRKLEQRKEKKNNDNNQ